MKKDLADLIKIKSIRDMSTAGPKAPFGKGIRMCFDKVIDIAEKAGLEVQDVDGYALYIDYGKGKEILGILGHLDVVDSGDIDEWDTDPFQLVEKDGFWFGRGVNDNKGPVLGCLYILKVLKELNYKPKRTIRLILGGAEETTWECMKYYFKYNKMPDMGFSPDCNFPIVNCEKGIICAEYKFKDRVDLNGVYNILEIKSNISHDKICSQIKILLKTNEVYLLKSYLKNVKSIRQKDDNLFELEYRGITALARNPHKGENAIFRFIDDFEKIKDLNSSGKRIVEILSKYFNHSIYGEKLSLYYEDIDTGKTTSNLAYVDFSDGEVRIGFDYRYPKGIKKSHILKRLKEVANDNVMILDVVREFDLLYIDKDSKLLKALKYSYEKVTNKKAQFLSKGAISYARAMKNCVGFGPSFEEDRPNSHKSNECINIENLYKALVIYLEAIKQLTDDIR